MKNTSKWQEILDEVQQWQKQTREQGHPVWYRGHSSAQWVAQSSLHRHIIDCYKQVGINIDDDPHKTIALRSVYLTLYRKFKARAWRFLDPSERSPWGIIFSMQHHGLHTLLLDWTESFACALYFAQQGRQAECDAAIYLLNPEGLNYESFKALREVYKQRDLDCDVSPEEQLIALDESFDEKNYSSYFHPQHSQFGSIAADACRTVAVAPFLSNPRMLAQRAAFTLCGLSFQPLEEQFDGRILKKITLPAETYQDSQEFLDLVGIGHFGYFPDIVNLVRDLKEETYRELKNIILLQTDTRLNHRPNTRSTGAAPSECFD